MVARGRVFGVWRGDKLSKFGDPQISISSIGGCPQTTCRKEQAEEAWNRWRKLLRGMHEIGAKPGQRASYVCQY